MNQDQKRHGQSGRARRPLYDQDRAAAGRPAPALPPAHTAPPAARRQAPPPAQGTAYPARPMRPRLNSGTAAVRGGVPPVSARTAARRKKRTRIKRATLTVVCAVLYLLTSGLFTVFTWATEEIKGENTVSGRVSEEVKSNKLPQYKGKNIICGLVCGIDYNNDGADGYLDPDNKIGNTDMIMYMMYNTQTDVCNVLTIPRDVYVGSEVPSGIGKINGVYYFASDPENRMDALAQVLMDQLQLPTDFYITIDMDALKEIVAIKGSIEVYVSRDVIRYDSSGRVLSHIEPGWRHLGPEETEFFLRNRNYEGADIDRLQMQQSFYSALFREFKTLAPTDMIKWMDVLLYRCNVGGIGPIPMVGLALEAMGLDGANFTFVRPPVTGARIKTGVNSAGEDVYSDMVSLVPDETAELLNQYFRPDGHTVTAEELNIHTLPVHEPYGKFEASVRTMADVQAAEPREGE